MLHLEGNDGFTCAHCGSSLTTGRSGWTCRSCGSVHGKVHVNGRFQDIERFQSKKKTGYVQSTRLGDRWMNPLNLGSYFSDGSIGRDNRGLNPRFMDSLRRLRTLHDEIKHRYPFRGKDMYDLFQRVQFIKKRVGIHRWIEFRGFYLFHKARSLARKQGIHLWNDVKSLFSCLYLACKECPRLAPCPLRDLFRAFDVYSPKYRSGAILKRASIIKDVIGLEFPRPSVKQEFHGLLSKLRGDDGFNGKLVEALGRDGKESYFSDLVDRARVLVRLFPAELERGKAPLRVAASLIKSADQACCWSKGIPKLVTWELISRLANVDSWKLKDHRTFPLKKSDFFQYFKKS
ncbi:MAG: hypothetical protein ACFFCS_24925 [Candidatus Hodarchaeota archaeon]